MCLQLLNQSDGPNFNTRSQTRQDSTSNNSTTQANTTPDVSPDTMPTPKTLTVDRLEALLQMQKTDPFCKCISKCLSNGKAPQYEQGYLEIYCKLHTLPQREGQDSELPSSNDRNPQQTF